MQAVTGAPQVAALDRPAVAGVADSVAFRVVVALATMIVIGAVALVLLLTPFYIHPALDVAGAPAQLGMTPALAHEYSDRTITDLVLGPGSFDFALPDGTPFYTADERGHMRDVRMVLYAFLGLAGLAGLILAVAAVRRRRDGGLLGAAGRGGAALAAGTAVVGVFAVIAFDAAFDLFHRLLFPGGNYSFDPTSQRLVQLYPLAFWQLTAGVLGALLIVGGSATWLLARRRATKGGGG